MNSLLGFFARRKPLMCDLKHGSHGAKYMDLLLRYIQRHLCSTKQQYVQHKRGNEYLVQHKIMDI